MIELLRSVFGGDASVGVDELGEATKQTAADLGEAQGALHQLVKRRREVLITGTQQDAAEIDREIEETERRIERLKERLKALRSARRKAEVDDSLVAMPERLALLGKALEAFETADAVRAQKFADLRQAQGDIEVTWAMIRTRRPAALVDLPEVDEDVRSAVRAATGKALRLARGASPDPDRPRAILGRDGWSFHGTWTTEQRQRFSRHHRSARLPPTSRRE